MTVKRAKVLDDSALDRMLATVQDISRRPKVDTVAFLLTYYAGLRVQEVAGFRWKENVFNAEGEFDMHVIRGVGGKSMKVAYMFVGGDIGKGGKDRTLSMNPRLLTAMRVLWADPNRSKSPFVIPSADGNSGQSLQKRAHALTMRLNRMYQAMGLEGASTHSGRRRFITNLARSGTMSLRDVQHLAGHANIGTTETYIEISDNQSLAIAML